LRENASTTTSALCQTANVLLARGQVLSGDSVRHF
jgi:hypothetical protein